MSFSQEEVLTKIRSSIAAAIRIDPRIISDLPLSTSMNKELNEISLGEAALNAADLLSHRRGHEQIADAILMNGNIHSTLGVFYISVWDTFKKMPEKQTSQIDDERRVRYEIRMLENASVNRARAKGFDTIIHAGR